MSLTLESPEAIVAADDAEQSSRRRRRRTASSASAPPPVSSVNLLSEWTCAELRTRRLRFRFGWLALALVLALAGGFVALDLRADQVRNELRGEQAVAQQLQGQIDDLAPVRSYVAAVNQRAEAVSGNLAQQADLSRLLAEMASMGPGSVELTSISLNLPVTAETTSPNAPATPAPTCPGPDPFGAVEVIGCVQLTGTAGDRGAVSRLVQDLAKSPIFAEPFVNTTTTGGEDSEVSFTGSVGLTPAALTGRFAPPEPDESATEQEGETS